MVGLGARVNGKTSRPYYIKNAAMSIDKDQQTDWTLVGCTDNGPSEGYNVYGFYAGWGALESTVGSAKQDITLPAGKYRMTGYAFFRQGLKFDVEPSKISWQNDCRRRKCCNSYFG